MKRRGETDACLPTLSDRGSLRMRDGERDMLRLGDRRGFNHLEAEVGVLGTLWRGFASSEAPLMLPSVVVTALGAYALTHSWF